MGPMPPEHETSKHDGAMVDPESADDQGTIIFDTRDEEVFDAEVSTLQRLRQRLISARGPRFSESLNLRRKPLSWTRRDEEFDDAEYQVDDELGRGGMGEVYSARQTSIARDVALKVMREKHAEDPVAREKFLSEAVITATLEHPNIVAVHELGEDQHGSLFYTMERISGVPWHAVIDQRPLQANVETLLRVCDAVALAHSQGVVHRDLKPSNVMLGEYGEVILMDWGVAVAVEQGASGQSLTADNAVAGSPGYMAPEMARGDLSLIGYASDVYLLGAILFRLVVGRPPHGGKTSTDAIRNAARNTLVKHDADGEIMRIAKKAMADRVEDRFPSAREFQEALRDHLDHHQSITLAEQAGRCLDSAIEGEDYGLFSKALHHYEAALEIWGDNPDAAAGLDHTRIAYAECALARTDLELAESQLDADEPGHADLLRRIAEVRVRREELQREADRHRRLAEREQARTRETNAFLLDILAHASPSRMGPAVRVLDAMHQAGADLDQRFADNPEVLGSLHLTLGVIFRDIGQLDRARGHLVRAGEILEAEFGAESREAVSWRNEWAHLLLASDRIEDAEVELAEIFRRLRRECGERDEDVLAARNNLANVYLHQGKTAEAEKHYRAVLDATEEKFGDKHPTSLVARVNLAKALRARGELDDALALYRGVLKVQDQTLGDEHPHTIATRADLARLLHRRGEFAQAAEHYRKLHRARAKVYGKVSCEAVSTRLTVAKIELAGGDPTAAASQAGTALDELRLTESPPPNLRYEALLVAAEAWLAQEAHEAAREPAAQAYELARDDAQLDDGHAAQLLALCEANDGELGRALEHATAGLVASERRYGEDDPRCHQARRRLAAIWTSLHGGDDEPPASGRGAEEWARIARACAEAGHREHAVRCQRLACDLVADSSDEALRQRYAEDLERYAAEG